MKEGESDNVALHWASIQGYLNNCNARIIVEHAIYKVALSKW